MQFNQSNERISDQAFKILDSLPVACIELDAACNFVYLNTKAEELLKLDRNIMLGRNYWEIFPHLRNTECYKVVQNGIAAKSRCVHEYFSNTIGAWIRMEIIPSEAGVVVMITVINEMQEAKAKLLEEQRRHKLAQEVGRLGYFELQLNGTDLYWSDELYRIHGLQPQSEVITTERFISFIHPDDRPLFLQQMKALHEQQQRLDVFTRIIRADGQIRVVRRKAEYLKDPNSFVDRIYGTVQDVTEEYEVRQEQRKSERLLNAIFETLPLALSHNKAIRDNEGHVVDFELMAINGAKERLIGSHKRDLIGKRRTEISPGIERQPVFAQMIKVAESGVPFVEEVYSYSSGQETWSMVNIIPLDDGVMVAIEDMTQRKQAEIERQKAFQILEASVIAVFEFGWDGRLVYLNKQAAQGWKVDRKELEGKKFSVLFSADIGQDWYNAIETAIYKRLEAEMEFYSPVFDGWTHMKVTLSERGVIVSFSDINNRKEVEEKVNEQAHFIKRITETVPDLLVVREIPSRQLVYVNEEALLLTEFHPDHVADVDRYYERFATLEDEEVNAVECQARQKGQDWQWFRVRGKVFQRNDLGEPTHIVNVIQNMTLQREAERQLKESRDLLQSFFDTTLMGIAVHEAVRDKQGNILDFRIKLVNHELEKLTGRTDMVGQLYGAEFPGIKEMGLFDVMLDVMKTGEPRSIEYNYQYDGFKKWFSSMFVKLNDGLIATNLDITEQKLAEEEKFKNLTVLQQSEEVANIGSWEYDRQSGSYKWSDGMYRLFELEKESDIEPEIYRQYSTERGRLAAERVIFNIKFSEKEFEEILEIRTNGRKKFIKLKATVVFGDNGQPERILGVDMDISAMKQAEDRIKEDAALIKGIADAAPDMLYVIDIHNKHLVYANNNVLQLFQKTMDEIKAIGSLLFEAVIYPADREKFEENIRQLQHAKDNEVKELTYRLIDSKGVMHWIKTRRTVYKRDEAGVPSHIIGMSQDITTQIKLKEKNKQLVKERKQMAERQQEEIFRATLSTQEEERKRIAESLHNGLGQLLYGVKLNMGQININRPDRLEENQLALQQTGNLLAEAIKESRRISHELMPTILEDFGLRDAIEDICRQFSQAVHFKCQFMGLTRKLDKFIQIAVYRIVQELMMNIVKHAEAKEAYIKVEVSTEEVRITVKDDGVGFNTSSEKSNGIGLKTIQSKVKLLNGHYNIISSPGGGSIIEISFPNKSS